MGLQSIVVLSVLVFSIVVQAEEATLPFSLQPKPLSGGCPSKDVITEVHDEVRSVLQDTVEPIRRQVAPDLNETNSIHCWVDVFNGDVQHCFSEEQWNKLQNDIKEGIYAELQEELLHGLTRIQQTLQNTTDQIQEALNSTESKLNTSIMELHNEVTQVQGDLNQVELEHSNNSMQLENKLIELPCSCKELAERIPILPSASYSIKNPSGTILPVYCDMTSQGCGSGTHGWARVAYLDMTDPTHQCPSEWRKITSPVWTCGRNTNADGCDSVMFSTNGMQYNKIMGRVVAYQFGSPEAFGTGTIDDRYLDGISITHGVPRYHIWSFAVETRDNSHCPCSTTETVPSFVGEDYFCESGNPTSSAESKFYQNDPLWDGQGCGSNPTCCTYNHPPWFCKQLPQNMSDDIEVRLCASNTYADEDTAIQLIELYIQ